MFRGISGACDRGHRDGWLCQRPVGVPSMIDVQDDHFALLLAEPVQHAIGAASG